MKHIRETAAIYEPTPEQADTTAHVMELAQAWEQGQLPLAGVRSACSGYDRWVALRCVGVGNAQKALLQRLLDALVADDDLRQRIGGGAGGFQSKHGYIASEELHEAHAKQMTNWQGERVIVWPMFFKDGIPHYPPVHIEPGEKRREREGAMREAYRQYRDEKNKGRVVEFRRA